MTGLWLDLLGRGWQFIAAGFLCVVIVGFFAGPGDEFSGAPAEPDDDEDDTAAWDRAHDEFVDRGNVL